MTRLWRLAPRGAHDQTTVARPIAAGSIATRILANRYTRPTGVVILGLVDLFAVDQVTMDRNTVNFAHLDRAALGLIVLILFDIDVYCGRHWTADHNLVL